ncbi:MAG: MBG domain-containing protein, partial [Bacilli bacterium]|nr:MBG domain-containing protein [Bacilli bacterium]
MKKLLTLLTSITLLLTSCSSVKEPVIKQFDTAHFDDASYIFDGHPHILNEVKDVPEGTTVTYEGRESYTNVGTYPATALLEKDGYESLTLNATLSITPANFSAIVFASEEVEYDGQEHALTCTGVPSFATVTYTNNVGTEIGVYNATAVISAENYNDLTLNATLTITTPLLDFDDAKMEDATIDYDGKKHTIEPTGIPEGTKVIYKGTYEYTNVGTYIVSCTLSKDGYHDKDLSATLTINSATLSGVTFDDLVVMYDGQDHEITVKNAPSGSKVTYSCKSCSGANKFKNVGVYEVEATVTLTNYYPLVLVATLSIVDETLLVTTDANKEAYTFEEPLMWDPVFSEMMKGNYTLRLTSGYWDDDNPDVKNDYSDGTYIASDGVDAVEYSSREKSELKEYHIYTNCGKDAVCTELNYSEDGDFYQNKLPSAAMDETEIKYYIGRAFVGLQEYTDGRIINGIDLDDYYASEGRAEVFNNHLVITMENRRKLDSG